MLRFFSRLFATCTFLLVSLPASFSPVQAQEPPPDSTLCREVDPARAIHLALNDDRLIIAVIEPTTPRDLDNGTPVRVIRAVEGALTSESVIADKQPALSCLSEGVWNQGQPVIGVFLVEGEELFTLAAWPFTQDRAQTGVGRLSIDELLARGRAFVEPTPTALPAGVPTPPSVVPPGAGAGPEEADPARTSLSELAAWLGVAGAAAVVFAGVVYGTRRRR